MVRRQHKCVFEALIGVSWSAGCGHPPPLWAWGCSWRLEQSCANHWATFCILWHQLFSFSVYNSISISTFFFWVSLHGNEDKMRAITRSCVLFLWMHALTLVKSQGKAKQFWMLLFNFLLNDVLSVHPTDCKLKDFLNGDLFDSNFDTTSLEESYSNGRQVRVGCTVGHSGFFKLICSDGTWISRGSPCQRKVTRTLCWTWVKYVHLYK